MKTVYILGAGFSVEAGAPTQIKLLSEAFRLHREDEDAYDLDRFNIFKDFLIIQLGFSEDEIHNVDIEDIFTPLDRCLSENSQFRGVKLTKIMDVREAVFHVIGRTIQLILDNTEKSNQYIERFAMHLTKKASVRKDRNYRACDPVSVLSTNWDILLDNAIYKTIINYDQNAVVDYCCYISSRDEHDESIKPGLEKLGEGGFNVKLLKLHGSLNWLQCSRCMRLYSRFFQKDGVLNYGHQESCRHCDKNFPEERGNHLLVSNLIMPTYIKDLSNPQYKIIWQNAGLEISEADELIFIGYSLPSADFEMRQLLSRMTRRNAKIKVVDFSDCLTRKENIKRHWIKFFGDRDVSFDFNGAKAYIEEIAGADEFRL